MARSTKYCQLQPGAALATLARASGNVPIPRVESSSSRDRSKAYVKLHWERSTTPAILTAVLPYTAATRSPQQPKATDVLVFHVSLTRISSKWFLSECPFTFTTKLRANLSRHAGGR